MRKIVINVKPSPTVFYTCFLPEVMGESRTMRLSEALVRSFVVMKTGLNSPSVVGGVSVIKNMSAEYISASTGVSLYDTRRILHRLGDEIDVTPVDTPYFPLLTGLTSDVRDGERVPGMKEPLNGLAMVVYSYLRNMNEAAERRGRKKGATAGRNMIDKWEETMAKEMGVSLPSLRRQIWKLEHSGWLYRFDDPRNRKKKYLWINEIPRTIGDAEILINRELGWVV